MTAKNQEQTTSLIIKLRNHFVSGLLFSLPLIITFYVVSWLLRTVDNWIQPLIPPEYNPQNFLPFPVPGLGIILAITALIILGSLTRGFLGNMILRYSEQVLSKMPIVRSVYSTTKQISEAVLKSRSKSFREVGMIEYPRPGIWALCFITGDTKGEVQRKTHSDMVNVFVPTTPNPTSGFLLFVPRNDIIMMDMSVEEGIKMVVSAGMITPNDPLTRTS